MSVYYSSWDMHWEAVYALKQIASNKLASANFSNTAIKL